MINKLLHMLVRQKLKRNQQRLKFYQYDYFNKKREQMERGQFNDKYPH